MRPKYRLRRRATVVPEEWSPPRSFAARANAGRTEPGLQDRSGSRLLTDRRFAAGDPGGETFPLTGVSD